MRSLLRWRVASLALPLVVGGALTGPAEAAEQHPAPARIAAAAVPMLGGLTSQDLPVVVRVARNRGVVRRALATLELTCRPSGDDFLIPDDWRGVPISGSGRFRADFSGSPEPVDQNQTVTASGFIRGRFSRGRTTVAGSWGATWVYRDATSGAVADTCTSGTVRFSAGG